nr:TerB family tellurite resistance protein [Flavobacteriales bacterium]
LEYNEILKNPKKYPIQPPLSSEVRLKQMHDAFSIIFADHQIDEDEARLLRKYAIAIGYTSTEAERIIKRSIQIYSGGLDFYDYEYLIKRK